MQEIISRLAEQAAKTIDFDELLGIANSAEDLVYEEQPVASVAKVKIAIAQDKGFLFLLSGRSRFIAGVWCRTNNV